MFPSLNLELTWWRFRQRAWNRYTAAILWSGSWWFNSDVIRVVASVGILTEDTMKMEAAAPKISLSVSLKRQKQRSQDSANICLDGSSSRTESEKPASRMQPSHYKMLMMQGQQKLLPFPRPVHSPPGQASCASPPPLQPIQPT